MSDTVILTFTYPQVEPFFDDFLKSCNVQSNKDFEVMIIDEGMPSLHILTERYSQLSTTIYPYKGTISQNRLYGLKQAKQLGYKYIVMADSDDYFSGNRVEKTKEILTNYDIVANDIDLVNMKGEQLESQYISKRLKNGELVDFDFIKYKNILGFSNSAFRSEILFEDLDIPKNLNVVDWYFYTVLLHKGYKALFTNEITTYYRQYSENMIGINNETVDNYKNKLILKSRHYKYLSTSIPELESFALIYNNVEGLEDIQIEQLLNKNKIEHPLWWENINI